MAFLGINAILVELHPVLIAFPALSFKLNTKGMSVAIEYKVSQDGMRIEAFLEGVLDFETTTGYFDRLQNDESVKVGAIEIVHFTSVTDFNVSYLESIDITEKFRAANQKRGIAVTIFVCESDLAFGMGRTLQAAAEYTNPEHKVVVVRSVDEIDESKYCVKR